MDIIFSENTGLYLYSALLQANAAIITLVGFFSIFTIQSIHSKINTIQSSFIAIGHGNKIRWFDGLNLKDKEIETQKMIDEDYFISYNRWVINLKQIKKVKYGIILPTLLLGIALISDIIFLFLSSSLHEKYPDSEIYYAFINSAYEIIIIIVISYKILSMILSKSVND